MRKKLREAVKSGALARGDETTLAETATATAKGLLTANEHAALVSAIRARDEAIAVDDYAPSDYPSTAKAPV